MVMVKTLVTGGSGLVGRYLKELMPDARYLSSKDVDLRSDREVAQIMSEGWDHVVHLAARVGGILDNMQHPAEFIEDNLLMNTLVLKHAREHQVRGFTAILSTCIYPDVHDSYPLVEEDLHAGPPQSTNFAYAIAKRALAVQIDSYNKQYGLSYNYLIPCNLYGKYDKVDFNRSHFLTAMLGKMIEAKRVGAAQLRLLGTGKPLRQFMYAGDLAKVISRVVDEEVAESFNVATSENLSIRQIAEAALEACGMESLQIEFDGTSPDGQYRKDVSNAKMMNHFPDFEFTPLKEGVRSVYDHYVQNNVI